MKSYNYITFTIDRQFLLTYNILVIYNYFDRTSNLNNFHFYKNLKKDNKTMNYFYLIILFIRIYVYNIYFILCFDVT